MIVHGGVADAADCNAAIDKAIAEWKEKESTWAYPGCVAAHIEPSPGQNHFFVLDQRTRVAFGRPIAEGLAGACGKSGISILQKRFENAPEVNILALNELHASDSVAESVVRLLGKREVNVAKGWPFMNKANFNRNVLVWASLCSPATRRATALALAKMEIPSEASAPLGAIYPNEAIFSFTAAVGDKDISRTLELAANDVERAPKNVKQADWRPYYAEAASFIRRREALAPQARDIRAKDDLLFWQANADLLNYHVASDNYKQSARTLANQHEKISTDYLLEKLREAVEEISRENYDRLHHLPHAIRLNVGSVGLILCILGEQRDPAAIPALKAFAAKNPSLAADIATTIEAIQQHDTRVK